MIKVDINIGDKKWKKKITNPSKYFATKLKKISKVIKFFKIKNITFTILLTNSSHIKKLNKKFRNKNKATDVLSFPFFDSNILKLKREKKIYIGDIALSYEVINNRSPKKNFFIDFDKTWIHGLLHLIGYNHIKNRDYNKMKLVEKKILDLII